MAHFGTALAHEVLPGVALGFLPDIVPMLAVFAICLLPAGCLTLLERRRLLSVDALLGVPVHEVFATVFADEELVDRAFLSQRSGLNAGDRKDVNANSLR